MNPRDYGFRHDETAPDHYVFHGYSGIGERPEINPSGDWTPYLPKAERQSSEVHFYDSRNCTVYGCHAGYEAARNLLGFDDYPSDCSDRYTGVLAGSDGGGNTPHRVLETIREVSGVIPEEVLPFDESIRSHEEYFSPKPMLEEFRALGRSNLAKFRHGHEWVFNSRILPGLSVEETIAEKQRLLLEALRRGPVVASVYAWKKKGRRYTKNPKQVDNHLILIVKGSPEEGWTIFDQYDVKEGDGRSFFKVLEWDYNFDCAKVLYLSRIDPNVERTRHALLTQLVSLLKEWLASLAPNLSGLWK